MDNVIRTIPVRDGHGDELTLYEYQQFVPYLVMMGINRAAGARRWVLDSGEDVMRIDDDNFMIAATGERLTRIR